jgi:hypothetical protein
MHLAGSIPTDISFSNSWWRTRPKAFPYRWNQPDCRPQLNSARKMHTYSNRFVIVDRFFMKPSICRKKRSLSLKRSKRWVIRHVFWAKIRRHPDITSICLLYKYVICLSPNRSQIFSGLEAKRPSKCITNGEPTHFFFKSTYPKKIFGSPPRHRMLDHAVADTPLWVRQISPVITPLSSEWDPTPYSLTHMISWKRSKESDLTLMRPVRLPRPKHFFRVFQSFIIDFKFFSSFVVLKTLNINSA